MKHNKYTTFFTSHRNVLYKCNHFPKMAFCWHLKNQMHSTNREDSVLVDVINKLREELSEGNYVNIGNLTALANNIEFLFAYAKDAFLIVAKQRDQLKQRLSSLQAELRRNNLAYIIDEEGQSIHQLSTENGLDALNKRMHKAIIHKGDLQGLKRNGDSLSQKSNRSVRTMPGKKVSSLQYARATNFVREQLVGRLQDEPSRSIDLPKNAILNLYLQWSQKHQQTVNYQHLSSIQMALTNQVRRQFPQTTHNSRSFRGIKFRPQCKPFLKTDIKLTRENQMMIEQQSDEESPPLPTFADDHLAI